ncbi:MAG TPA: DNA-binding transcriptional regulator [Candidatus Paceibacterota bacterium]|nr:DNA-binding transcriptional regulator [Candidatus Paceibacterota bacterium]
MRRSSRRNSGESSAVPKVVLLLESSRASGRALLCGVASYAHHHGPWSFFWEPAGLEKAWPLLRTLDADGLILRDVENVDEVLASGIPAVVVGHSRTEIPGLVNVVTDSQTIGRMAAEHLLNAGFRVFGYCGMAYSDTERTPWSQQRGESFSRRIAEAGFETHFYRFPAAREELSGSADRLHMARWLESLPKPAGIMACNDDRGQQVIEACRLARLNVPDQVAVIGVDNNELICGLSDPPMSSVAVNFERAGYESAEILDQMMRGRRARGIKILVRATHVVARRSTDIVAVDDPHLASALRFIRDHSRGLVSVPDVARAAGLSRRVLEKRFKQVLKRSALQEIRRARVATIGSMLVETNQTIAQIALALGFTSEEHIARYFRREKNMTPLAYRRLYGRK